MTRETVLMLTPASVATSRMVGSRCGPSWRAEERLLGDVIRLSSQKRKK
jgi:hypothetical protein